MQPLEDSALLRQYADHHSDESFATLVTRHVNLVYSVALRQVGHPQNAEEITQAVFIILAKKAAGLRHERALSSWLFQAARLTAINFVRSELRRRQREQEAQMQTILNESGEQVWPKIAPLLDDAVARLREPERRAIVLRFYEGRSLREVGLALGASEEAAKKRVARALEKLRQFFAKRGVDSTTAAIAETISANSILAAPAVLAKTATAVALAKGTTASTSTLTLIKGALKIMAWTKVKTTVVVGIGILFAAGTTTLTVKEIHRYQNDEWQLAHLSSDFLLKPPHRTVILPTRSAERSRANGTGGTVLMADGRAYGIDASIEDMLRCVFAKGQTELSPTRTIVAAQLPTNRYDYLSNLPRGGRQSLEQEIQSKFGVLGKMETIETNVLFLKVEYPSAAGLKPSTSKTGSTDLSNGFIRDVRASMDDLAGELETLLKIPVINQTGLTNRFDFKISWNDYAGGHPNLNGLKQALTDQLGLDLMPGRAPVEMLVVEKAKSQGP